MPYRRFAFALVVLASLAAAPAASAASSCDPIDDRACLLPWPNNHFTAKQKGSATGLRLDLSASLFPKNDKGKSAFPPDLNRNDGFSPGSVALTYVPGLDLARSGAVPITNMAAYSALDAPIVVIDAKTGKRHPIWTELDTSPDALAETRGQTLMIHNSLNYKEGRRYVVALRNLKDSAGNTIPAGPAFAAIRDGKATGALAAREKQLASSFAVLKKAGIERSSLYLAWDFTVASEKNLSQRALSIRNTAFAELGDRKLADGKVQGKAPGFKVTTVTEYTEAEDSKIARQVEGTFTVPCFLTTRGCVTGGRFKYKRASKGRFDSIPARTGTATAPFICRIPRTALTSPARPSLYGHGLLGRATEVRAGNVSSMASEHNMAFCATPEIGMAEEDIPNAIKILGDMSLFGSLADRLQQGLLNELLLGRLMINSKGFVANAAFKNSSGSPVLDISNLFYDSNSQGAILGGALTALSPDFRRASLGVPGMNYSELLPRSVDFDTYEAVFKPAYPSRFDRILLISIIQNLWDRGESNGYAHHMTSDPLAGTPKHNVLLQVALGDHQVAQVTAEKMARTSGAAGRRPVYDPGRSEDVTAFWGIADWGSSNAGGSGIVMWDSGPCRRGAEIPVPCLPSGEFRASGGDGTPVAPTGPVAPRNGRDPHSQVRDTPEARQQKSDFLKANGRLTDTCPSDRACRASVWPY